MASRLRQFDGPDITQLLLSWSAGDQHALDQVATVLYDELKGVATRCEGSSSKQPKGR